MKRTKAKDLQPGMWLVWRTNKERVVNVQTAHGDQIRVETDFGSGGYPATSYYEPRDVLFTVCEP